MKIIEIMKIGITVMKAIEIGITNEDNRDRDN